MARKVATSFVRLASGIKYQTNEDQPATREKQVNRYISAHLPTSDAMATVMQSDAIELETHETPLAHRQNVTQQVSDSIGDLINYEGVAQQLKPADGGIAAWKVLFAAFMFEAMMWGESPAHGTPLQNP
ncbi:MAG: hypothetical protein LQ337_003854 [Flavoplaca oasis]|nr:MAG: hypothetical protein LQ337_003854 [Flavoplaca oasis]